MGAGGTRFKSLARLARALFLALPLTFCLAPATAAASGEPRTAPAGRTEHPPEPPASDDATSHHPFDDPEKWAKLFDDPARDAWQKPAETVAALGLRPGMIAADLGAGTGYFEARLSEAVGSSGLVLAIDPEPEMVRYLGRRARRDGLSNVLPILGLNDEPFLPRGRVDRVLIADTYHHIDDRLEYFGRMRQALAPGGKVAVVDFHKRPLPVGPPPEHKLSREHVLDEMKRAGWRLSDEKTFLPYQYFLIFEPAAPGAGTGAAEKGGDGGAPR